MNDIIETERNNFMSNFNDNNLQKFYCYACNHETLGQLMHIQTSNGIRPSIMCNECGNIVSLSLLDSINRMMNNSKELKPNIDSKTGFVVGSPEYNDYYYPKIDKSGIHR